MKTLYFGAAALVIAAGGWWASRPDKVPGTESDTATISTTSSDQMVQVSMPALEGDALIGSRVFAANCAACHGDQVGGIDGAGPPLIHKIYEPGHHGDMSFVLAAKRGVTSHHWPFGNMAPIDGITDAEIAMVITFVRTVQRENGIF